MSRNKAAAQRGTNSRRGLVGLIAPLSLLFAAIARIQHKLSVRRDLLVGLITVLVSLVCSGTAGAKLSAMGGIFPMGLAMLFSGALIFTVVAPAGMLRKKDAAFWWLGAGIGVASAATNGAFAIASSMIHVGTVVPIMGLGTLAVMILKARGKGWRIPTVLTLGGFVIFSFASGQGHSGLIGIAVAVLGAIALGTFTFLFQKAANRKGGAAEGMAIAAISHLVGGGLLLGGAYGASLATGQGLGGGWTQWRLLLQVALLGFTWMTLPTLLNNVAAKRLPGAVYAALQPLGSPISLLVQIAVLHQATSAWPIVANLLISGGGVSAVFLLGSSAEGQNPAAEAAPSVAQSTATVLGPEERAKVKPQLEEGVMARYGVRLTDAVRAVRAQTKRRHGAEQPAAAGEGTEAGTDNNTRS
ncbi:hypothetical protein [Actinoallomurus sp. NPDC050550]|uniref:hypothetical protein n=1 Tax=Actinoallomurus sp. NPDC050550 TaxID=3154937 RepID=UPI0033C2E380